MQKSIDTDWTPRSAASDLVYTVCQCPINGTLGLNGFNVIKNTRCPENMINCVRLSKVVYSYYLGRVLQL